MSGFRVCSLFLAVGSLLLAGMAYAENHAGGLGAKPNVTVGPGSAEDAKEKPKTLQPRSSGLGAKPNATVGSGSAEGLTARPGLSASLECAQGFTKEIKPDHPGGFYVCRIAASPPCAKGYKYEDMSKQAPPTRFKFECEEWEDWRNSKEVCPQGWTKSGSGFHYYCTTSDFRCRSDHRLDPHKTDPYRQGPFLYVYSYRCNAR